MTAFSRTDRSIMSRWWWTVDRLTLGAILLLCAAGLTLVVAASPVIAERLQKPAFYFAERQMIFFAIALPLMLLVSLLSPTGIRRLAMAGFVISLLAMIAATFFGAELNGARRWISLAGFSFQPSELVKPCLIVITAWLLTRAQQADTQNSITAKDRALPQTRHIWWAISLSLFLLVLSILLLQPDVGMAAVVSATWLMQCFLAGLPWLAVGGLIVLGLAALGIGYWQFDHVRLRIDSFLFPEQNERFQTEAALDSFRNGGVAGRGPGEGILGSPPPDAHTDFIFAIAGEEFGLVACLLLLALFAFISARCFLRIIAGHCLFRLYAAGGLITLFTLQAVINMGVNLDLLPTKGMTLPFVSYGGSSLLAMALVAGMLLALTRRREASEGLP